MTSDQTKHILVLYTSCGDDHGDEPSSSLASDSSTENNASDVLITQLLHSIPIACDILILPEIPADSIKPYPPDRPFSEDGNIPGPNDEFPPDELVEFVQNRFLPCGLANVLVLENLPWQQVLLSLTSCSLVYNDGETLLLPVHPTPSTFDFRLGSSDRAKNNTSLDNHLSTIDLDLVFDVTEARLQLEEILQKNSLLPTTTTIVDDPLLDIAIEQDPVLDDSAGPVSNRGVLCDRNIGDLPDSGFKSVHEGQFSPSQAAFLCAFHDDSLSDDGKEPFFQPRNSSTRLDQELKALQRVHAIIEQEAANLDRLLQVLSLIGLGLFIAMVWSGYQLYRANKEDSSPMVKALHQSVESKILRHSALSSSLQGNTSSHATPARRMDSQLRPIMAATTNTSIPRTITDELCTPRIENLSRSKTFYSANATPMTPTRIDFSSTGAGGCCQVVESPRVATSKDSSYQQEDTFICGGRAQQVTGLDKETVYPFINFAATGEESLSSFPRQKSTFGTCREETTTTKDDCMKGGSITGSITLSPCSLLAKNWSARKTARRSHRKKNNDAILQPLLSEPAESLWPTSPQTSFADPKISADNGTAFLAPLPRRPTTTLIDPLFQSSSSGKATIGKEQSNPIPTLSRKNRIVPEKLQRAGSSETSGNMSPWGGAPKIPDLVCSTPSSSDDSFVDDYW